MKNGHYDEQERGMLAKCKALMLKDLERRALQDAVKGVRLEWEQRDGMIQRFIYIAEIRDGREIRYSTDREGNDNTQEAGGMEA